MKTIRTAIITGAANGIGKAISLRLVQEEFRIIIVDVDIKNGEALAASIGANAHFYECDICSEKSVEKLFTHIKEKYGKLDVLVNNAGIIRDNVIWKMPVEDFDKVVEINLKGTWLMCKNAAVMMRSSGSGRIVNISSRAWLGNKGQSNYAASKAGIIGLTRVLALELGGSGVYVNAIAPGLIDTPLTQKLPQDVQAKLIEAQPTKKMGKPEDIAQTVAFLCDQNTQFITGQTIYVDGGKSIGAGI